MVRGNMSVRWVRRLRIALAAASFILMNLLFLDATGIVRSRLEWLAALQFVPALLAMNLAVVAAILLFTFLFGRVYCSVLCPLGVLQDLARRISLKATGGKRPRGGFTPPLTKLKISVLAAFILLFSLGMGGIAALLEPYGAFGRMASTFLSPLGRLANGRLAVLSAQSGDYAFMPVADPPEGTGVLAVAILTFAAIAVLASLRGRLWCNALCPVGTLLGFVSRFARIHPRIDASRCVKCGLCARSCRSECIDVVHGTVDACRCVDCLDCAAVCAKGAIRFTKGAVTLAASPLPGGISPDLSGNESATATAAVSTQGTAPSSTATQPGDGAQNPSSSDSASAPADSSSSAGASTAAAASTETESNATDADAPIGISRRAFIAALGTAAAGAVLSGMEGEALAKESDGGLAPLADRTPPVRRTPVIPPGARSLARFSRHCVACQLCVQSCPNHVLKPSTSPKSWMQPFMAFEEGRCRPECVRCGQVCPTGAIQPVTREEKSSIQVGYAVWDKSLCLPVKDGVPCGNCSRHCPSGAILMMPLEKSGGEGASGKADAKGSKKASRPLEIPLIDQERCIGCGACEHLCPSRPVSAIHVEGIQIHRTV